MQPDVRTRILEGTYECVARQGIGGTSLEDAARAAGVSRATVYRHFPGGRDELVDAVIVWQFLEFFARLYEEVHDADSLEEVLTRALVFARRAMLEHEVLQRLLETEPELLLPKMTIEAERVEGMVAGFLLPYVARQGVAPGVDVHEAADYLARMTLSLIAAPGSWDLSDPAQVADVVRVELLAWLVPPADG